MPDDTREWIAETSRMTPLAIVARLVDNPLVAAMTLYVLGQKNSDELSLFA